MANTPKILPSQSKAADVACGWLPTALETQCRGDVAKKEAQQKDTFVFFPASDQRLVTSNSPKEGKGAAAAPAEDRHYKSRRLPWFDFSQYAGESWLERITRQLRSSLRLPGDNVRVIPNLHFPRHQETPPPADVCGDSSCTGAETAESCAADCAPVVEPTPDAAVPVETPDAAIPVEADASPPQEDAALPPPEQDAAVPEPDAAEAPPVRHICDGERGELPRDVAVSFVPGRDSQTTVDVGDVNGDGVQDVVIGSYFEGKTYIVLGREGEDRFAPGTTINLVTDSDVVLEGDRRVSLGEDIVVKDIDHDGIDDIAIGLNYNPENANMPRGAYAFVYGRQTFQGVEQNGQVHISLAENVLGNDAQLRQLNIGLLIGSPSEQIGNGIKFTGDVNGDGRDDMVLKSGNDTYADILPAQPIQGRTTVDDLWNAIYDNPNGPKASYVSIPNGSFSAPGKNILSTDVDGDGEKDLVFPDGDTNHVVLVQGGQNLPNEMIFQTPVNGHPVLAQGNWIRIHGQDPNWGIGEPTTIDDVDNDGIDDLVIAQADAPVEMGGQTLDRAGKVFVIPGVGIQTAMANHSIAWGGDYEIENLMAITGGFVLKGSQANGAIGLNGLSAVPNHQNPAGAKHLVVGAAFFNNTNGCSFVVCGDGLSPMAMQQVIQRNVANVDQSIEGDPASSFFGSLTKSTSLGLFVRQGWVDGQQPGAGVWRLFRNP